MIADLFAGMGVPSDGGAGSDFNVDDHRLAPWRRDVGALHDRALDPGVLRP